MKFQLIDPRKTVQVQGKFYLQLKNGERISVTKPVNLCSQGICCDVRRCLPLFEEMEVNFQLKEGGSAQKRGHELRCQAVVVQCEKKGRRSNTHRVTLYFTDWNMTTRQKITRFVRNEILLDAAA